MILFVYFDSNSKLDIMVHIFRDVSGYVHSLSHAVTLVNDQDLQVDEAMHQQPDRMIVVYIYINRKRRTSRNALKSVLGSS